MKIYFAKVKENAIIPSKRDEDAGYDFYACFEEDYLKLEPLETKCVPTGIAFAVDKKHYLQIEERSSIGFKGLKKSSGIIDSGYRGEIILCMFNANTVPCYISKLPYDEIKKIEKENQFVYFPYEKAVAQGIVHKLDKTKVKEISYTDLKKIKSLRGEGKTGSSNK